MTLGARVAGTIARIRFRGAVPLVLLMALILALGAYTAFRQGAFLTSLNLRNLLLAAMPLVLVSMGQTCALLVGGFDVSVAALMTVCVVAASYTMSPTKSTLALIPGALLLVGIGLAVGFFNALLIRVFRLPSIIATLGTLSILQGVALWLRAYPSGSTSSDVVDTLQTSWSFVPLAFIGVVVLALLADLWLYRSRTGMALRAVGLDETSSRRIGIRTTHVVVLAFVACSVMASIAGFYQAAYSPSGSPIVGNQALESIAAGVLGGASLAGGRGSFFGTLLAALFLTLIDNSLALFHQPTEYTEITIGVLILVALILYQGPELVARLRTSWGGVGRLRGRGGAGEAGEAEIV
ncbi:MAG: ABC transporter permease [Verrucomicrobiota bacterium]